MQVLPTDIIHRYNNTWLKEKLLLSVLTDLNADYFRTAARPRYKKSVPACHQGKDVLPDSGKAWRWCKIDGEFFYSYSNIPDVAPKCYRSQLPTEKELLALAKDSKTTTTAPADLTKFFEPFITETYKDYLHCYGDCTDVQQTNLATACAILEACVSYINTYHLDTEKNAFFMQVAELAQSNDWKYFPHNFRIIKDHKVMPVIKGAVITDIIKLPRADNKNASQYDDKEVESWVIQLRDFGANYTNAYIIRKIEEVCMMNEKPVPSVRWTGTIMQRPQVKYLTANKRFGENSRFAKRYQGYVPLANALFAGDCWQVDSTRFNIIPHKHVEINKDGEKVTSTRYFNNICVRDVYSGDVLGNIYDYSENRFAYVAALQMAVQEAGYLPYEIVFDKFPGHNTVEFKELVSDLENRGVKITFTSKANGKARLERHFGTMQTVFMQDSKFYYGEGIKSRRNFAHRSEAYIKSVVALANKQGFDFEQATSEAETILHNYRTTPLSKYSRKYSHIEKSPKQLHIDSEKPSVIPVSEKDYAFIFGLKKILPVRNEGLLITEIHKTTFKYRITEYDIVSRHTHVLVCYNLEDLGQCHLYEVSDKPVKRYLGAALEIADVQLYGPSAEWNKYAKQKAIICEMEESKMQELEYKKAVGDDILPFLSPTLTKKSTYEDAETSYTNRVLNISPRPEPVKAEEAPVIINVRNQY